MLSKAAEDFLKAVYVLYRRDGEPVSTSAIASNTSMPAMTSPNTAYPQLREFGFKLSLLSMLK